MHGATAGSYFVTISEVFSQEIYIDTLVVYGPDPFTSVISPEMTSCDNCSDGSIDLTISGGNPPYYFIWSNGETSEDISGLSSDTYTVTITDSDGCAIMNSAYIDPHENQQILLHSGWNCFSTYIIPVTTDFDSLFSAYSPNIIIIKDDGGHTYWPVFGLNGIGNFQVTEGYQACLLANTTITIHGNVVETDTTIQLPAGWSMIPFLYKIPRWLNWGNGSTIYGSFESSLIIFKDEYGNSWFPLYFLTYGQWLLPGRAYYVKLMAPSTLVYPPL